MPPPNSTGRITASPPIQIPERPRNPPTHPMTSASWMERDSNAPISTLPPAMPAIVKASNVPDMTMRAPTACSVSRSTATKLW